MRIIPAKDAVNFLLEGEYSIWCRFSEASASSEAHANIRLSRLLPTLHAESMNGWIGGRAVYAIGSCFAREIELHLAAKNWDVLSLDRHNETVDCPLLHSPVTPDFYNRFNSGSMLREIERLTDSVPMDDRELVYEAPDGFVDMHFASRAFVQEMSTISWRREESLLIGQRLRHADLIVITLGLNEAWYDTESSSYLNSVPGVNIVNDDRFELRIFGFNENKCFLLKIINLVRSINPFAKFIISVSPVPMLATFSGLDVVLANSEAKSILRAVAAEVVSQFPHEVSYFPSYELVTCADRDRAWMGDRRHITGEMVAHVADNFDRIYGLKNSA